MNKPIRHGEILLMPVKSIPTGRKMTITKVDQFIVGHSETGHHHVLESNKDITFEVTQDEKEQLYFRLFVPTNLVHKKATDKHKTLKVPAGLYKRFHDTEYDPFGKVIRAVAD